MADLLIAAGPGEWRAAWVEDGEARELYIERGDTKPPGSRHLGRVVRIVPALDAALVDIGDERPAFLPLRDAPPGALLTEGAPLVVEVRREAWQDKAPRLTAKLVDPPALPHGLSPPATAVPDSRFRGGAALAPAGHAGANLRGRRGHRNRAGPSISGRLGSTVARGRWLGPVDLDALFDAALAPSLILPDGGVVHIDEARTATTDRCRHGDAARRFIGAALRWRPIATPPG